MTKKQVQIYLPLSLIVLGIVFDILSSNSDNPILSSSAIFVGGNVGICLFFIEKIYSKKNN